MSAPVEFRANPVGEWKAGVLIWEWPADQMIAIDLRWVASASPWKDRAGLDATNIKMAGDTTFFCIDCPYPKFMEMWTNHMEART